MMHARLLGLAAAVSAVVATAALAQPPSDASQPPASTAPAEGSAAAPAQAPAAQPGQAPAATAAGDPAAGEGIFKSRCAVCHESGAGGAPDKATLAMKMPSEIFDILKTGPMMAMASGLSDDDMHNVAAYLTTPPKS